ncbi:SMC-Scp complex subunit ScpB [Clostridium omnivorum]|uniref:Segregation and condensation protein B n=1 Tax=Clostridium omnivorum TaxID=1604902 RepID=A0ABQ5NB70_9CLOT|nr:SMC-Scp complex subunit ScpB [Clostridium sp. E14]GLC32450.1 segregation and condensation protein B [Clostridium sp. E14]
MNNYAEQMEIEEASKRNIYYSIIESILFVSGEPLLLNDISSILECETSFAEMLLQELSEQYNKENRGIQLIKVNAGYQLVTKAKNSEYVQKLLKTNTRQSLSQAALETLAIVAYKQPITRASIDEIRGVKSDRALTTLMDRNLLKESGRLDVVGRPILYSTTDEFLRHFGLDNLKQMPSIDEIVKSIELFDNMDANENKEENKE